MEPDLGGNQAERAARRTGKRRPVRTRFDEAEKSETELPESPLKAWYHMIEKIRTGETVPTQQECADFFTRIYAVEPEERRPADGETAGTSSAGAGPPAAVADPESREQDGDDGAGTAGPDETDREPLLADDDDVLHQFLSVYSFKPATYRSLEDRIADEDRLCFYPADLEMSIEEKIESGDSSQLVEPRLLENEGLFVGRKPDVAVRNLYRMESRLLKSNRKWIGADGMLLLSDDPVRQIGFRPSFLAEFDSPTDRLDVEFVDARPTPNISFEPAGGKIFQSSASVRPTSSDPLEISVDLNAVYFTYHYLFNRETLLAVELDQLCSAFLSSELSGAAQVYAERLDSVRHATKALRDALAETDENDEPRQRSLRHQLESYLELIFDLRRMRDSQELADKTTLMRLIQLWDRLKKLRVEQGFVSTAIRLEFVKKTLPSPKESADKRENEIDLEVAEERQQHAREREKYRELLAEWKAWSAAVRAKKAASRRTAKRRARPTDGDGDGGDGGDGDDGGDGGDGGDGDQEQRQEEDMVETMPGGITKPKAPKKFDAPSVRKRLIENAKRCRWPASSSPFRVTVAKDTPITPLEDCPTDERTRRTAIGARSVQLELFCNGEMVSRLGPARLNLEFQVDFGQVFNVRIGSVLRSIQVKVFELAGALRTTCLATVWLPLPEASSHSTKLEPYQFSCSELLKGPRNSNCLSVVTESAELPVTSDGQTAAKDNDGEEEGQDDAKKTSAPFSIRSADQFTTGFLRASIVWKDNAGPSEQAPPSDRLTTRRHRPGNVLSSVDLLSKWVDRMDLDPNDPANAELFFLLSSSQVGPLTGDGPNIFRLDAMQDELELFSADEIHDNLRFSVLEHRWNGVTEFTDISPVGIHSYLIDTDAFERYTTRQAAASQPIRGDTIEAHRRRVQRYLTEVSSHLMSVLQRGLHQMGFRQVVNEDEIPDISSIGKVLKKAMAPRRPLRPARKKRKRGATVPGDRDRRVHIVVQVLQAFNVPVRSAPTAVRSGTELTQAQQLSTVASSAAAAAATSSALGTANSRNAAPAGTVNSFVELGFQRRSARTNVANGPNPSWNEELKLVVRTPNSDYSPPTLQALSDALYVNLYDEITEDISDQVQSVAGRLPVEGQESREIHRRVTRHWLGGFEVPFSSIYMNGRVEGTLRVHLPPILLAYRHVSSSADKTFLNLMISLEPPLALPESLMDNFPSDEDATLRAKATDWLGTLAGKFKQREFIATVIDMAGRAVFVTRYLSPIKPPDFCLGANGSVDAKRCHRFVSHIPTVADTVLLPGTCDVWATCEQFIDMLLGDQEEHAVLLTNYLLFGQIDAYICLGRTVPDGLCSFVLTRDSDGQLFIWNPCRDGEVYSVKDSRSPMRQIFCLINSKNIWANIQSSTNPPTMSFNLVNTSAWQPFFTSNFPNPGLSTIQPDSLTYWLSKPARVTEIEQLLENVLWQEKMRQEWRPQQLTRSHQAKEFLRERLRCLEEAALTGDPDGRRRVQNDMDEKFRSYDLNGFTLNFSFAGIERIVEGVYSTRVWETPREEFAFGYYVHPFGCNVFSVWVYLASLKSVRVS